MENDNNGLEVIRLAAGRVFFCSESGTSELQDLRRFTKNKFVKEADK